MRFNLNAYKNLSIEEVDALSDTASNFFHFVEAFGNKLKVRNFVNIWMVKDGIQNLDSVTCGIFQLYFYDNSLIQTKTVKYRTKLDLTKEQ